VASTSNETIDKSRSIGQPGLGEYGHRKLPRAPTWLCRGPATSGRHRPKL